ncbi:DBH-like monooxygenase protein 1 homolog [Centruroides sculpturatus]|uniref:DBH-like monooxygenase protein 1 homolog n=1 Tax=Centruroides sculpturatus TaxID=218467 RepID=UPI000C6CB211|nr:DBH-like monooxygenase protein 1 homolog [Centruroides sculpturatus]
MNSAIFLLFLCFYSISTENWNRYLKLDRNYEVWWSVEGEWVTFQVEVATRGWIGFGISPNGGMASSDLVIGWVNNGKAWFHDRHAEGNYQPIIDDHQDWELLWCCENDTHTSIRFKRMLITCDDQDLFITNDTTRFIYAYHSDDPTKPDTVMYHGANRRGTVSVMINYKLDKPIHYESPEDIEYWDVTSPNILLPEDKNTTYYCTLLRRPNLDKQHHIIKVAPLIQPGNEKFVHHIILYECMINEEAISPFKDGTYYECYDDDGILKFPYCLTASIGWAVGGEGMYFPENVGIPIGMSNVVWYLLQIHYDNPEFARGIVDSSGLRISYTPKLRQYDGSMLTVGSLWYPCVFVPPNQKEFIISGHGHPSCLRQGIPPEGIKIFSSLLHSHLIAKKITVRHFRNNEELPPLDVDKYYDFNYQVSSIYN